MKLKIYQIDAFTDRVFSGNPAAVCPLESWLPDDVMQKIASENNLAETAYYVKTGHSYEIRWFTPTVEVDLCGHATIASAYVLFNFEGHQGDFIQFQSPRSGPLGVRKEDQWLTLDFPTDSFEGIDLTDTLRAGFDKTPTAAYKGKTDYMVLFDNEIDLRSLKPNLPVIAQWPVRGVIATAKGDSTDFVSRFFGPQSGVPEDPVTGSAHTTLTPFWSQKLNKTTLTATQVSAREGQLICTNAGDRTHISGQAVAYLVGEITI
jgi:PhzF family phenazine biosynthesis protein